MLTSAALLLGSGCLAPQQPSIRLSAKVEIPKRAAVIFFVDGLDRTRMMGLLEAGELPNIAKYFVEGGVGVRHAVTSMPAITYPNSVSLLTGCFPGHHGIMGNLWFDRRTMEIPDYIHADSFRSVNEHFDRPTIYEVLHDHFTVSVQFHTRRGVTHTFDNLMPTAIDWYTHNFSAVDRRVGYTLTDVIRLANREQRWPTVMTYYFPGVDETGHRYSSASRPYDEALMTADHSIGIVCDAINASKLADRTYFVLTTDHAHVPTPADRHFDLARWLEQEHDMRVWGKRLKSKSYDQRLKKLAQYDAILFTDAGRRALIHLRGRGGWYSRPEPKTVLDLAEAFSQLPAIGLTTWRDEHSKVQVRSHSGSAFIERKIEAHTTLYRLKIDGTDPLGYSTDPTLREFVAAGWHDSRTWLAATIETAYPDFVPQVVEMFDSPRAGDIVLFAAEDWAFDEWQSGHGSCLARDMHVPMYFAGPDLHAGAQIEYARNVDIMPTILDLLGEAHRLNDIEPIDGRSVAEELRRAENQLPESARSPSDSGELLSDPLPQPSNVRRGHLAAVGLDR
ncbi:MAG: alkaline phosphatase family protein [Planctomycetota bacterium]|nr:alkaline phosphatase family protein [Planctomycetota bacterium]